MVPCLVVLERPQHAGRRHQQRRDQPVELGTIEIDHAVVEVEQPVGNEPLALEQQCRGSVGAEIAADIAAHQHAMGIGPQPLELLGPRLPVADEDDVHPLPRQRRNELGDAIVQSELGVFHHDCVGVAAGRRDDLVDDKSGALIGEKAGPLPQFHHPHIDRQHDPVGDKGNEPRNPHSRHHIESAFVRGSRREPSPATTGGEAQQRLDRQFQKIFRFRG